MTTSIVVVRADSPAKSLSDLRGRRIAAGAGDSPQATLIPLHHIAAAGVQPVIDAEVVRFDVLLGKHGDPIGGERDAARALIEGRADAACMIDGNHLLFSREGVLAPGATRVLFQTPPYDHCNFTVLDDAPADRIDRSVELLLAMSYAVPAVRPLLDIEVVTAAHSCAAPPPTQSPPTSPASPPRTKRAPRRLRPRPPPAPHRG